ncbi:MAG: GxGYxYP family putative glycoside hydrolase [Opitutaceae bacterium]
MITFQRSLKLWGIGMAAAGWLAVFPSARAISNEAWVMQMSDDWTIEGDLPTHALLLSLQGLANRDGPRLYFEYTPSWPWKITGPLKEFYERRHGFAFTPLANADEALARFASCARGYVVWDKEVRTSLIVAFTVAGLEDVVVVSEDLIHLVEKHGLNQIVDLRGEFAGMPDHEIYAIAMDRYWDRCSRDVVIWMGGVHGNRMEPGMADWGIYRRAFFTDLSNNPMDPEELALTNRIYTEQNPQSFVMGWHSYAKDTEGQQVSLISSYGLRMEGLNTLPNLSFNSQIPFTEDFVFTNNHSVEPDEVVIPEEKVYVSLVQTDSIGIGAWTKPGRGAIPYAWQVSMSWVDLAPACLQYFFEGAMPNDYFIGGLTGPSYMYPKPIPAEAFPVLMAEARRQMKILDLRVMETMDYSEGNRHVGNTELTREVADRYYENFPDVIGFINGYGSARTFDLRDDRPLISYDYYLGLYRPEDEAVADLEELIHLNRKRPYFLLIHVRESKSIEKTVDILKAVREPIEIVPLDVFLKMAASNKTYRTRYQQPDDPIVGNPHP